VCFSFSRKNRWGNWEKLDFKTRECQEIRGNDWFKWRKWKRSGSPSSTSQVVREINKAKPPINTKVTNCRVIASTRSVFVVMLLKARCAEKSTTCTSIGLRVLLHFASNAWSTVKKQSALASAWRSPHLPLKRTCRLLWFAWFLLPDPPAQRGYLPGVLYVVSWWRVCPSFVLQSIVFNLIISHPGPARGLVVDLSASALLCLELTGRSSQDIAIWYCSLITRSGLRGGGATGAIDPGPPLQGGPRDDIYLF